MSATTEKLLEDIELTKRALEAARVGGPEASVNHLTEVLSLLQKQLTAATEALTENKQLLKG